MGFGSEGEGGVSLNHRQEAFAREYLVDLNATAAYMRAGYKATGNGAAVCAYQLLQKPEIQRVIQESRDEVSKKTLVSVEFVIGGLKEVAQRCLQRVPVMRREGRGMVQATEPDANGQEQGVWEFDSGGANRSLELLGKHIGAFNSDDGEDLPMPTKFVIEVVDGRKRLN